MRATRTNNYVAFLYSGLSRPSNDIESDGEFLALDCIGQLNSIPNEDHFPPKLLILLTSTNYLEVNSAAQLIAGIKKGFENSEVSNIPPLIGTSVAAVFFNHKIYEEGVLLICIASRLIDARVAIGRNALTNPEAAVEELVGGLGLADPAVDVNPMSNRMLLTFFPDIRKSENGRFIHKSDVLHKLLWTKTSCRIPIAGGTSSNLRNGQKRKGIQFCNWRVLQDTLVAAQVDSGVPLGVSLCRGLERVRDGHGIIRTRVVQIASEGNLITRLEPEPPAEIINGNGVLLFGEDSVDRDFIVAVAEPSQPGQIKIIEQIVKNETLQLLKPRPEALLKLATEIVARSNRRVRIKRHIGCFSLICSAHLRSPQHVSPYIERAIENIERAFDAPCVGGFVDGEAGVDETGRSQFGNWSMAGIVFGDEMRDRTPRHRGFMALVNFSHKLNEKTTLSEAIDASLHLIFETGFAGARLSFVYPDQEEVKIVCVAAFGPRFKNSRSRVLQNDYLRRVYKSTKPLFTKETEATNSREQVLLGNYVIPLQDINGEVIAILEVDLGTVSKNQAPPSAAEQEVLLSLGAAIGAGLNGIFNLQVANTARGLDEALTSSLHQKTLKAGLKIFSEAAAKSFGADMSHIRLAGIKKGSLELVGGYGEYYKAAKRYRCSVKFDDGSPTCEAYYSGRITIVNDAVNNAAHKRTIEANKEPLKAALERIRSCANVVFNDVEGEHLGIINIVSTIPWFFTMAHKRSLSSLANRTALLVKHLKKKEDETQAHNRIEFLLNASPQLARVDFTDTSAALSHSVSRFCRAAHADYGSLYLFDKDIEKYVLRAHYGWAEPQWVNAARYETEGGWLWNLVQQSDPAYYPELVATKQLYAKQMFGTELRPKCRISALGLPLTLGTERLGILALYRKQCGSENGFATTSPRDLADAADPIAALVGIILSHHEADFRERMQSHFKGASDIFVPEHARNAVEHKLCKYAVDVFNASSANLFWDNWGRGNSLEWVAGYSTLTISGECAETEPDTLLLSIQESKAPLVLRTRIDGSQHANFEPASLDGLLARVLIPIFINKCIVGVLDLTWDGLRREPRWEPVQYRTEQLRILGTVIGSAYNRYLLTADRETARRAEELASRKTRAMGLMHEQSTHITGNLLIKLQALPDLIRDKRTVEERERLADDVQRIFANGNFMIEKILEWAKGALSSRPNQEYLMPMLKDIVERVESQLVSIQEPEISIQLEVDEEITVYVDENPVKQAFFNILNNCIDAIGKKPVTDSLRAVTIKAQVNEAQSEVEILFQDTGIGMRPELIEAAKRGFLHVPGNKGFGVLSSIIFIGVEGGTFDMDSDGSTGTTVCVTLPCVEKE